MNDHLLVEALRGRDVGAPAAMYAAYADRLYAYCWFQLRERDAAQVAHPAVDLRGFAGGEHRDGALGQLSDGPGDVHGSMMTLSR